ncbi:MAG TPA: dual specificity protein phosphatase family protein [Candidatus Andersenbacteria bacterium]|nr:dual specificity protein phosphatase family protein [Candidatus Andersenbacteria bacterium]
MKNKIIDVYNHALGRKGFDYDQINDDVFIGTNMCCQLGFEKELLAKNVRADISLEELRVDAPLGVDYFLWLPTKNYEAPTIDKLNLGVQTLEFLIKRKVKVYIHCKNGHGRAPTLYIAYLIKMGMEVTEAIEHLKSKRPAIHLTREQIQGLEAFKNSLKE